MYYYLSLEYLKETMAYVAGIDAAFYKEYDMNSQLMQRGNGYFVVFLP